MGGLTKKEVKCEGFWKTNGSNGITSYLIKYIYITKEEYWNVREVVVPQFFPGQRTMPRNLIEVQLPPFRFNRTLHQPKWVSLTKQLICPRMISLSRFHSHLIIENFNISSIAKNNSSISPLMGTIISFSYSLIKKMWER